jgi:hypothetical protein
MDLIMSCEIDRRMEMTKDCVKWGALVFAAINLQVLLPVKINHPVTQWLADMIFI